MELQFKQSQGNLFYLYTSDKELENHFSNRSNCTKEILSQLDNLMYNFYFKNKKNLKVLDIGANIGLFSAHVADCCDNIYSVEPTPSHFDNLKKVAANFNNITPYNYALNEEDGIVKFYLSGSNSTMNSLIDRSNDNNVVEVEGIKLSSLIEKIGCQKIDFCKIDIEGSELKAVTEQSVSEVSENIDNFFIEYHEVNNMNFSQLTNHFTNIFENCGYKCEKIAIDAIFAQKI